MVLVNKIIQDVPSGSMKPGLQADDTEAMQSKHAFRPSGV